MSAEPGVRATDSILVVDDEPQIRRVVRNAVASIVPRVLEAASAQEAADLAGAAMPGLIVLDLSLPDRDGLELCRDLRAFTKAPILVLSARHTEQEKAALLDAGADDYLTKPFGTLELQARVRALLRRAAAAEPLAAQRVVIGDLEIDLTRRSVQRAGAEVHLTPTEWGLLRALLTHRGRTLTHQQLFHAVWGQAEGDAQQYLRVYVGHLRRKIEADPVRPRYIQTDPGVGYRFEPDGVVPT